MTRRVWLLVASGILVLALMILAVTSPGPEVRVPGGSANRTTEATQAPPPRLEGASSAETSPPAVPTPPEPSPGCLVGRIVDEEGAAVGGLHVRVGHDRPEGPYGEDGRFEIEDLVQGVHLLHATDAYGRGVGDPVEFGVTAGRPCTKATLVVPVPRRIGGIVVTPQGLPVRDLLLRFQLAVAPALPWRVTRTNAEGRFDLRVWRDGPFRASSHTVRLQGECEVGRTDARLVYDPTAKPELVVRIMGPDGKPIPKCTLQVMHGTRGSQSGLSREVEGGVHRIRTDRLRAYVEIRVLRPRNESDAPLPYPSRVVPDVDRQAGELLVILEEGRTVRGVVVDASGTPVEGIGVSGFAVERLPYGHLPLAYAVSGADGGFELRALPQAPVRISVRSNQGAWLTPPAVTLTNDEHEVRLVLSRGAVFEVWVRGPEGEPVVGAFVHVRGLPDYREKRQTTDGDGIARFEGMPSEGPVTVAVWTDKLPRPLPSFSREGVSVADGPLVVDLPAPVEITGIVVDEKGRPWSPGTVFALGQEAGTSGPADRADCDSKTGRFALRRLRHGRYRVWLQSSRRGEAPSIPIEVVAPARDVRIVRPNPAVVTGRLRVENPGDWDVQWLQDPGAGGSVHVESDGRFRIEGVRNEQGTLYVTKPFQRERPLPTRSLLLESVRPSDGPFEVVPVAGKQVSGHIVGFEAEDWSRMGVRLERGPVQIWLLLQEDGWFERCDLPGGEWTLVLSRDGTDSTRVEGVEAGTTDLVVRLEED